MEFSYEGGDKRILREAGRATTVLRQPVDSLTGAMSFEEFENHLAREYARSKRYHHPLAIIKCDVDTLKLVNNGFGRDAGDEVLRELHARVKRVLRATDLMARGRDDEFVIMLTETALPGAAVVAERIRKVMMARPISSQAGTFPVTISCGYSAVAGGSERARLSCTDLLESADAQLRTAMGAARNSICGAPAQLTKPTVNAARTDPAALTIVPAPEELTLMDYGGTSSTDFLDSGCRYG